MASTFATMKAAGLRKLSVLNIWKPAAPRLASPQDFMDYQAGLNRDRTIIDFKFLDLPAEMRVQVYELALVEPHVIKITGSKNSQQPALLMVNRQIRLEARRVYYGFQSNTFTFEVVSFDASLLVKWLGSSQHRACSNWVVNYTGVDNWANLHAWLKATYDAKTNGKYVQKSLSGVPHSIPAIFMMMMQMKNEGKMSWEKIDKCLNDVRQILTYHHASWGWVKSAEEKA